MDLLVHYEAEAHRTIDKIVKTPGASCKEIKASLEAIIRQCNAAISVIEYEERGEELERRKAFDL